MILDGLRKTFLDPRGKAWFGMGLVIESAPAAIAERGLRKLARVFPGVPFNLLSRIRRTDGSYIHRVHVRHLLGGLRLIWRARRDYDLVVFFASGRGELRLCRALALLLMRPRRFFVFNEFGEGFWLHRSRSSVVRAHLERRFDIKARFTPWQRRWKTLAAMIWSVLHAPVALADAAYRLVLLIWAVLLFFTAFAILAILRLTYDTKTFRFRGFGRNASAPRRSLPAEPMSAFRIPH